MKVKRVVAWLAVMVVGVLCCAAALAGEVEKKPWVGMLADGTVIGQKELAEIIRLHNAWKNPFLRDRGWAKAELSGANLSYAELSGANLSGANLRGANLSGARLNNADLSGADLREANLVISSMSSASLVGTDLRGANLSGTNLRESDLFMAKIGDTKFAWSRLSWARFEPDIDTIGKEYSPWPDLTSLVFLYDLWLVTYEVNPQPLAAIRDKLRSHGFVQQSRMLAHALKHNKGSVGLDSYIAYYLVAWPTEWGLSPLRPIAFMLLLMLFPFTLIYFLLAFPGVPSDGKNTIWRIWPDDALFCDPTIDKSGPLQLDGWGMLKFGFYFSLLSAFHIGWRDLNVGNWISRMQPREYTLRATGWVRVVSGIQSLVSVYLLALALLTYFGRPFE